MKTTHEQYLQQGYEAMTCDINALSKLRLGISSLRLNINVRDRVQLVYIPETQRGNLKKFRGQNVKIVLTPIARDSARRNFYVKVVSNG